MTKKLLKRGLPPIHPGELPCEEILPALDRPKAEIAKLLGGSRRTLYDILDEKQPVTPGMALRLGKLCGSGPDLWLNLQKRYDLRRAQQEFRETIKAIPTLEVAGLRRSPLCRPSCAFHLPGNRCLRFRRRASKKAWPSRDGLSQFRMLNHTAIANKYCPLSSTVVRRYNAKSSRHGTSKTRSCAIACTVR